MKWTVTPDVDRYNLTFDGEELWIELKKELSAGDQKRLTASGLRSWSRKDNAPMDNAEQGMELNLDLDSAIFEKIRIWLVDWSLTDEKSQKLPKTQDTFRALRSDVFDLLESTIDKHAKLKAEQSKKTLTPVETITDTPKRVKTSA